MTRPEALPDVTRVGGARAEGHEGSIVTRPEVLAPAGDEASLEAALGAGADAVYLGLSDGFNARARAKNFTLETLPAVTRQVHAAGAKLYVTLNTLVFEPELGDIERLVRGVARAGVDAIIVQDPAVALLARALAPSLDVHASTQMTISDADAVRFAKALGISRVVAPREHSIDELRGMGRELPLEVFVHGALCVSWSGQCLTSETWGGRSANRGQCAQSCRLPYELVVDGRVRELGDVRYLLSPKDLAGLPTVPSLAELGVASLKIEGRQKGPAYVATATEAYRSAVDGAPDGDALARLSLTYSRGFSDGFLAGSDHQSLVEGRFPKHRGLYLGRVVRVERARREVTVRRDPEGRPWTGGLALAQRTSPTGERRVSLPLLETPRVEVRRGAGVVFDRGAPEEEEAGGPVFEVEERADELVLRFGEPGPELAGIEPGQRVWVTSDPDVERHAKRLVDAPREGRLAVALRVEGRLEEPLVVHAEARGREVTARTGEALSAARGRGLDEALLREKLGALGGTPFRLTSIDTRALAPASFVPPSALKSLRRALVMALEGALVTPHELRDTTCADVGAGLPAIPADPGPAVVVPLVRTPEQLEGAIDAGAGEVELDWMERVGLGRAFDRARAAGLRVSLATLRVGKPGEEGLDEALLQKRPDAILVRHFGALERLAGRGVALHGDFSLNVTNALTGRLLLGRGLAHVTASFDLDEAQLLALVGALPPGRVAVVVHHRVPMFHTEHCVIAHTLSEGRDHRSCGRPCERHEVSLRDRKGQDNPVIVDVGCRNTVFEGVAQSSARLVPELVRRGVRRLRIDLVRETREETARLVLTYRALAAGELAPSSVLAATGAKDHVGVAGR